MPLIVVASELGLGFCWRDLLGVSPLMDLWRGIRLGFNFSALKLKQLIARGKFSSSSCGLVLSRWRITTLLLKKKKNFITEIR